MRTLRHATAAALLAATLALTAMAGCMDWASGTDEAPGPEADLQASTAAPWAGEPMTFDGQASDAGDAEIATWRFDFGDGTVREVDEEDEARLQHTYGEPGVFTATLTVTTEAKEGEEPMADSQSLTLGVGERVPVDAFVVKDPVGVGSGANASEPFQAGRDVREFELNLTVAGSSALGLSRVLVEVIDPTGEAVASQEVTVEAGEEETVLLDGPLNRTGAYEVRLEAEAGASDATGELRVLYGPDGA